MASPTKRTKKIRKAKLSGQGTRRKGALREKGTTLSKAVLFGDED